MVTLPPVKAILFLALLTSAVAEQLTVLELFMTALNNFPVRGITVSCTQSRVQGVKSLKYSIANTRAVSNKPAHGKSVNLKGIFLVCEDHWQSLPGLQDKVTFQGSVIFMSKNSSALPSLFLQKVRPRVDQEFYIFNMDTGCLSEFYFLNSLKVQESLICTDNATEILTYLSKPTLTHRRYNLRGVKLNLLTENDAPNIILDPSIINSSSRPKGHPDEVFQIPLSLVSGSMKELLVLLSKDMNFEANMLLRRKRSWGKYNSTAGEASGMLLNAEQHDMDMIFSSYSISEERNHVVKWLFPIVTQTMSIFVAKTEWKTKIPWLLYTSAFAMDLWGLMLVNLFLVSLIIVALTRITATLTKSNVEGWNFFHLLWTVFISYFGMKPDMNGTMKQTSAVRIVIFVMALVGTLVFMSYRAALTSELSVELVKPPFTTLEEFCESKYK